MYTVAYNHSDVDYSKTEDEAYERFAEKICKMIDNNVIEQLLKSIHKTNVDNYDHAMKACNKGANGGMVYALR